MSPRRVLYLPARARLQPQTEPTLLRQLSNARTLYAHLGQSPRLTPFVILESIHINCAEVELSHSMIAIERSAKGFRQGRSQSEIHHLVHEIHEITTRLLDKLLQRRFYFAKPDFVTYYDNVTLFDDLRKKLPTIGDDCLEAGKCLALGRYPASVFHLMRVMELCVVELGKKLGIQNASEKTWAKLLPRWIMH